MHVADEARTVERASLLEQTIRAVTRIGAIFSFSWDITSIWGCGRIAIGAVCGLFLHSRATCSELRNSCSDKRAFPLHSTFLQTLHYSARVFQTNPFYSTQCIEKLQSHEQRVGLGTGSDPLDGQSVLHDSLRNSSHC